MRALIEPPGRDEFELILDGEPTYSEDADYGMQTAEITCALGVRDRDRIKDAPLRLFPLRGDPWIGRVANVKQGGGLAHLSCVGPQHDLARKILGPKTYCDTFLSPWQETTALARNKAFSVQTDSALLRIVIPAGTYTSKWQAAARYIQTTAGEKITFDWTRPTDDYRLVLYRGSDDSVIDDPAGMTGTTIIGESSGGNSGSSSVNITSTTERLMLYALIPGSSIVVAADTSVTFANVKVYGVDGVATVNANTVFDDVLDALPTWMLPAGGESRAFIEADTTALEPLVFAEEATAKDILAEVMRYRNFDFGFYPALIAGRWQAVPFYTARSTTPVYQAILGRDNISGDLTGDDISATVRKVRVLFQTAEGRTTYVDVSDTDEGNYLVAIDHEYDRVLRVNTTSSTLATSLGQRYLDAWKAVQVSGTLEITGPITSLAGAEVWPCEIHPAKYIRLHNTDYGTVDCRITHVDKIGDGIARLTLDNAPSSLEAELAMLDLRAV